jgi:hypothetical protein
VAVDEVETSVLFGNVQIEGLVVDNPPGFTAPTALRITKARVRVNPTTVFSETLVIEEVVIDGVNLTFEGSPGRNNLSVLNDNVRAAHSATGSVATGPPPGSQDRQERRVILREFRLTSGHVTAWLTGGRTISFALPEIRVRDLGTGSGGITPRELAGAIAQVLQQAVTRNVAGVGRLAEQGTRSLEDSAKAFSRSAEQATSKVLGGLSELFQTK